jgi:hypothetical protein
MAVYRVLDGQLVQEDEFRAKGTDLVKAMQATKAGVDPGPSITLDNDMVFEVPITPSDAAVSQSFTPVKFGDPLTVDIRYVYSGNVGTKGGFLGIGETKGDIAVCSGVKEWSAFKASARALNWVAPRTYKNETVKQPTALQDGTRLISYQKAVATKQVIVSVEIASAPYENQLLEKLGGAFTTAAKIPLLMPYAGYLLAAGQIVPAVGKLLETVTGGHCEWVQSEELNFGLAGTAPADAGFRVIARGTAGFDNHRFDAGTGLIGPDGKAYTGDDPYVVVALDGAAAPELESFTASVAGAELMRRFQMGQSGQSGLIDGILDLTTIISDVKFRDEAITLKQKMKDMSPAEKAKTQPQLDALIKNIVKSELRP